MNVGEFLDTVESATPAPVYLFCPFKSPKAREATFEPLLAQRAVERLTAKYVDPGMRDLCYSGYHADETDAGEIVSMAQTVPFLTQYRVVVVQSAERYEGASAAEPLLPYLESPNQDTILVFVAKRVDKRSRFYKACKKSGVIVECPAVRERDAATWAQKEATARGKRMDGSVAGYLIRRTGTHLGDVVNAVSVLCDYVGDRDAILEDDIAAACADVAEEQIWALTDAIAASEMGDAVRALRALLDLGKNEFEILGSINWLLKTAYTLTGPPEDARGVNPYVAGKVRPLAKKLGREKVRDAFSLCMEAELRLRSTGVNRALALELLVVKLAAPRGRRTRPAAAQA
ncbi:MAG: DNA polymerase III subunit delta [Candidatus Hydrogenedentes bacterium]|nr:DNA polymerase III subunit delta [Candidatus Hydrogenedentota bacterium]